MAAARPILSIISIILLAGGIVLQFFIILSGAVTGTPLDNTYFLQTTTRGITGGRPHIPNPARWTYFALCGDVNGRNGDCYPVVAALPFDPIRNFQTRTGVPAAFDNTSYWYYMSRFAWVFYIIALFFAVIAFLLSVFALCARLGAYLTGASTMLACFFQALAAALMTAWTVQAQKHLKAAGETAKLGEYAYGFTWGAFAAFFICTILFCVGGSVGSRDSSSKKSGGGYFGRKKSTRSTRSRGSFRDSESARRVKDEYD